MTYDELKKSAPVVLVEFYASWCPHCRKMMPVVEQVKQLLAGRVPVYQFDIDKESALSDEVGVDTIPTFIIYSAGGEVWRYSGEIDSEALMSKVEQYA